MFLYDLGVLVFYFFKIDIFFVRNNVFEESTFKNSLELRNFQVAKFKQIVFIIFNLEWDEL